MRLGAFTCELKKDSHAYQAYQAVSISERHRHRYEFNNKYKDVMEKAGFVIAGSLKDSHLCEIAEVKDHPWMVGVQFHPEFKSKPTAAHPLFKEFIQAMIKEKI
jgi:CTP synthase